MAMAAGAAFADTAITSANIVGYVSTPSDIAVNTFTLGRIPFAGVASGTTINIADAISCTAAPGGYDTMTTQAPQLQVWNGTGYDMYYYINDAGDNMDELGWSDSTGYIADVAYAPGTGFWFKSPSETSSFTLPGEVLAADSVTKDIPAGTFFLMGSPFPQGFSFEKVETGLTPGSYDTMTTDAPQLQIWNGTGYDMYYYISDAGDNMDELGWSDSTGYLAEGVVCDSVNGMWVKSPTAGTLTFAK